MTYVDIGDAKLWVEDDGGEGVPLVLMHAAAGHSGAWAEQRSLFAAAGYRAIAYDMRGFGRTAPTRAMQDGRAVSSRPGPRCS